MVGQDGVGQARYLWGEMPCLDYLGFGAEVVTTVRTGKHGGQVALIMVPQTAVRWQAERLQSGMRLRSGAGSGAAALEGYSTAIEALDVAQECAGWW